MGVSMGVSLLLDAIALFAAGSVYPIYGVSIWGFLWVFLCVSLWVSLQVFLLVSIGVSMGVSIGVSMDVLQRCWVFLW